jgi:hypothetical protein
MGARRPWLEALKEHCDRRGQEQEETREAVFADAPGDQLTKPTKAPAPAVDIKSARTRSWGEDESRLIATGWSPKERCGPLGLTIWANPETGFYCSREVALHRMDDRSGA